MDARSGDSFTGPFSPVSRPSPMSTDGGAASWDRESGRQTSPKRTRNIRIAIGSSDLPHAQGSVSRVDLASLARKLHVPMNTLSRSLGAAEHVSGSVPRDELPSSFQRQSSNEFATRGSSSISVHGAPVSPTKTPYGSASVGSARDFFSPPVEASQRICMRSAAQPIFDPASASTPATGGDSSLSGQRALGELPLHSRSSIRVKYTQNAPITFSVPLRGQEIGVTWEMTDSRVTVQKVSMDSPAELAGVKEGMRLLQVDGRPILTRADLVESMNAAKLNETIELTCSTALTSQRFSGADDDSEFDRVDQSLRSEGETETERGSEVTPSFAPSPTHNDDDEDDLEFEVHEDGHARVLKGRRDSAYLLNDASGRPYFAVEDATSPKEKRERQQSFQQLHGAGKRPSFFGSIVRQMSGVLGFSKEDDREPLLPVPEEQAKKRVLFADDGGNDLVTSVRHYEEIDTVVLELVFVFPTWVWCALFLSVLTLSIPLPLMLKAHHSGVPASAIIGTRALVEVTCTTLFLIPFLPSLKKEGFDYLKVDRGWLVVVLAGLGYAATTASSMLALVDNSNCGDDRVCPPIVFECLAPFLLVLYYSVSRYYHKRKLGQSEKPWFNSELVGLVFCVGGSGLMLVLQYPGVEVRTVALCLCVSLGMAVDTLMRRRVASQLAVPLTLCLIHIVSAGATWIGLVASRTFSASDIKQYDHVWSEAVLPGVASAVSSYLMLLVLRHLHPYPVVSILVLSVVLTSVFARLILDVPWDNAPTVAFPACMSNKMGENGEAWIS